MNDNKSMNNNNMRATSEASMNDYKSMNDNASEASMNDYKSMNDYYII